MFQAVKSFFTLSSRLSFFSAARVRIETAVKPFVPEAVP
jgi:hypothetical protein